jgi:beta-glucosidase
LSNLQLSAPRIQVEKLRVTVDVENVGPRAGEEVVQLYIRDPVASLARPVKELKDFKRVTLQAGEKRTVEFTLTRDQLAFWNREMRFVVEPGEFRVMVGTNSQDVLEAKFEVVER